MGKRVYWISTPEQLKALTSPIRHDIVDRLAVLGPLSVRALADSLGRKPTAIYRHLVTLEKFGLIIASETSGARGRPAVIYRPAASLMRLSRASRINRNRAPMAKIAGALARQAVREYAAAFKSDDWVNEGAKRNHWFFELRASPSPDKLAKINGLFDELAQLIRTPDPKPGRAVRLTWFMAPAPAKSRRKTR